MPKNTPWGASQSSTKIARGVVFYETAGHGGIRVSETAARKHLSTAAMKHATFHRGGAYWYEEDCDAFIVLLENDAWRETFAGHLSKDRVHDHVAHWCKAYFDEMSKGYRRDPLRVGDTVEWIGYEWIVAEVREKDITIVRNLPNNHHATTTIEPHKVVFVHHLGEVTS